ncbi:MAG: M28 family peptidase [Acidobacteriota bacterium]
MKTPLRRRLAVAVSAALVVGAAYAANLPADVSAALAVARPEALRGRVRFLADDLLAGRGTATRGFAVAARYVESEFAAFGLQPLGAGGSYELPVALLRARAVPEESRFAVVGRQGEESVLEPLVDYAWSPGFVHDDARVDAAAVFVGYGVTTEDGSYDDYAGVQVRQRIVVIADGAPAFLDHDKRAYYASSETKLANALAHGAAAVLTFRDPRRAPGSPERFRENAERALRQGAMTWVSASGEVAGAYAGLLARAYLSPSGVDRLFGSARSRLRAALLKDSGGTPDAFALPASVRLRLVSVRDPVRGVNVGAVLRGSDPERAGEYVVITAHLDHLGSNEALPPESDRIYNGAYDNAVGVAALLEVAHSFASLPRAPRRSLIFLALTGEEKGLLGARAFVDAPPVPVDSLVADINLDMFLAPFPVRDVVGFGEEHSSLGPLLRLAAAAVGFEVSPDPAPGEVVFVRSDQYAFVRAGIPSLFVTEGTKSADPKVRGEEVLARWRRERYHTVRDDLDQPFDWPSIARWAQLDFLVGWEVAQADGRPRWNHRDFFGDRFGRRARR